MTDVFELRKQFIEKMKGIKPGFYICDIPVRCMDGTTFAAGTVFYFDRNVESRDVRDNLFSLDDGEGHEYYFNENDMEILDHLDKTSKIIELETRVLDDDDIYAKARRIMKKEHPFLDFVTDIAGWTALGTFVTIIISVLLSGAFLGYTTVSYVGFIVGTIMGLGTLFPLIAWLSILEKIIKKEMDKSDEAEVQIFGLDSIIDFGNTNPVVNARQLPDETPAETFERVQREMTFAGEWEQVGDLSLWHSKKEER